MFSVSDGHVKSSTSISLTTEAPNSQPISQSVSSSPILASPDQSINEKCLVLYDYSPTDENLTEEVNVTAGEIVDLIQLEVEKGWTRIRTVDGSEGVVPTTYLNTRRREKSVTPRPLPVIPNEKHALMEDNQKILFSLAKDEMEPEQEWMDRLNIEQKLMANVLYPYKKQAEDELSIEEGANVSILQQGK